MEFSTVAFDWSPRQVVSRPDSAQRYDLLILGGGQAAMGEMAEFPHVAMKYDVQGVPKTIINDTSSVLGAQPESLLAREVPKALGK